METHKGPSKRYNGKCKTCGAKFSTLATRVQTAGPIVGPMGYLGATPCVQFDAGDRDFSPSFYSDHWVRYLCRCGKWSNARPVLGKFRADKKCNATCQAASGHDCECSCGGKNHGAAHSG